ncbi:MAG: histidinol-phosphate transaminase [Candidatus Ancillula sp.]|jgi:histidinol-phosphate aminotransferase|nr:histidinol-phosphate transaminase [Candidatus Ancillula sp.]
MQLKVHESLQGLKPYKSFDERSDVRLNTNENPYQIPDAVLEDMGKAVQEALKTINRYPQDNQDELKDELVKYLAKRENIKLKKDNILLGNGSNEIFALIFEAFGGGQCITFSPSYSMYPHYCLDSVTELVVIPRDPDQDFEIDTNLALRSIRLRGEREDLHIVLLTQPNNPTGNFADREQVIKILDQAKIEKALVVIDEAYAEFRNDDDEASLDLISKYDNLIVVRTLSKAFSLAGARVGYAIAQPKVIDILKLVRLPYNLSALTQAVAITALKHSDEMLKNVEEIKQRRDSLSTWLKEQKMGTKNLQVIPSSANFIQVGTSRMPSFPKKAHDYLLKNHSIEIRQVGPEGFFRVTIGTEEEMDKFKSAFSEFLKTVK